MNPAKAHNWKAIITDANGNVWNELFAQSITFPERKLNTVQHNENGRMVDTPAMEEVTKAKVTFLLGADDDSARLDAWFASAAGKGAAQNYTGSIRVIMTDFNGTTVIEEEVWYGVFPTNIKRSDLNKTQKAENSTKEVEFTVKSVETIL